MKMSHLLFAMLLLAPAAANAGAYRCKDASGQTVLTDKPCAGALDLQKGKGQSKGQSAAERYPFLDPETGDPELIIEVARRRAFYTQQGMAPDEALDRAVSELAPDAVPAGPRAKSGRDNNREYLEMLERDKAEKEQSHQRWIEESNALDAERERDQRKQAEASRRADCEERARVAALRGGYIYSGGACD